MPEKSATLRVADALQRDVGRGIARIDPKVVEELGLTSGDVVQITGKKKTTALCFEGVRVCANLRNDDTTKGFSLSMFWLSVLRPVIGR